MEQVIYGDVLFVINFAMDLLSLWLVGGLLHLKRSPGRLAVGAAIGSAYAVVRLFFPGAEWLDLLLTAAVSALMTYCAYGGRRLLGNTAVFFAVGFLMGGVVTAVYRGLIRSPLVLLNGQIGSVYERIPPLWLLGIAGLSALVTRLWEHFRRPAAQVVSVSASVSGRQTSFEAMCDSGDLLREPLSGLPVLVASPVILRELVPEEAYPAFSSCEFAALTALGSGLARRARLIPASSVTDHALLPGLLCDRLTVNGVEREGVIACGRMEGRLAVIPKCLAE